MKVTNAGLLGALLGFGVGLALGQKRRAQDFRFEGRSVVITGGSRGLGLVLARELARHGARIAILARDALELERAEADLRARGAEIAALPCDLRRQEEVNRACEQIASRFGGIDVLVNNAGIIQVGPFDHMSVRDFQEAMAIHLFAPLFATLAVLPHMRRAGRGRIVNIASIGGKIAVPHLLPYSASKFALVGFSDGLRAELRRENILVTTVCPGLMRTGSTGNALFKGQHRREFAWFALSDSLPLLSVSAERAARQILRACRRGNARLIIGVHAKGAVLLNELFPGAAAAATSLANRLLPNASRTGDGQSHPGHTSRSWMTPAWLTRLNDRAAARNNEQPV